MNSIPTVIFIISIIWMLANAISFALYGAGGCLITNYACMALIWILRKPLQKHL